MPRRINFDPKLPLVAARAFTFLGKDYGPGDPFAPEGVDQRMLARQYEARAVNHGDPAEAPEPATPADLVTMEGPKGGRYTITAPWLDEPEVVRGKAKAEARLAELKEAGEPASYKGFTLTENGGGWYAITKDGVEGVDGAEAPALKVQGEDAARAVATQLRAGETPADTALPEEWTPQPPEGEQGGSENGSDEAGEGTGQQGGENAAGPDQQEPGGDPAAQEATVADENKDKQTADTAPNEPGTNEPNGAEVINDQENAGTGTAGDDGEGDDGSAGTVGP